MEENKMLGVDIGGSGIKGAIIDLETGKFLTERLRIPTPSPATPKAVAKVFNELVQSLDYSGPICLLYTSPSPRDKRQSRMPSSA